MLAFVFELLWFQWNMSNVSDLDNTWNITSLCKWILQWMFPPFSCLDAICTPKALSSWLVSLGRHSIMEIESCHDNLMIESHLPLWLLRMQFNLDRICSTTWMIGLKFHTPPILYQLSRFVGGVSSWISFSCFAYSDTQTCKQFISLLPTRETCLPPLAWVN